MSLDVAAEAAAAAVGAEVAAAVAGLDLAALESTYREQGEFLFLMQFLAPETVARLRGDVDRLEPGLNRNYIPRHKKGGSVSHFDIAAGGPALLALYRSAALRAALARIVGAPLQLCPDDDPHACALYFYTEPGDHTDTTTTRPTIAALATRRSSASSRPRRAGCSAGCTPASAAALRATSRSRPRRARSCSSTATPCTTA